MLTSGPSDSLSSSAGAGRLRRLARGPRRVGQGMIRAVLPAGGAVRFARRSHDAGRMRARSRRYHSKSSTVIGSERTRFPVAW
jgi:hypothetical protein